MTDSGHWDIDKLAAQELLAKLGLGAEPRTLDLIAGHFARHRRVAQSWAAKRIRTQVMRVLEEQSMEYVGRYGDDWMQGVGFAQLQVASMPEGDLLDLQSGHELTKGQILRSMVKRRRAQALRKP